MKQVKIFSYITFILMVMMTSTLYAQEKSLTARYLDSIIEDEEGNRLLFPHFVFEEPYMNEIYVIDGGARVIIYTSDFFPVFTLTKSDGIEIPQGLTVDKEGNLYIAQPAARDNPRHRVSVFNACLKWERDIYLDGFEGIDSFPPYRVAVDKKGNLYVAGLYYPGILIMNNQGQLLDILSPEEEDKKVKLNSVYIDEIGRIYLVSEEVSHIYVYDENRKFLFKFGEKGGSTGKLSRPQAVGVDSKTGKDVCC
jgi:hypothetical protein